MADKNAVSNISNPPKSFLSESERRAERRLLCSNLVRISWSGRNGGRLSEDAVLEDLSSTGFGLSVHVGTPLDGGTELSITVNRRVFIGVVTQCTTRELGYLIGVRLDERCERFDDVDHLVDVMSLDLG